MRISTFGLLIAFIVCLVLLFVTLIRLQREIARIVDQSTSNLVISVRAPSRGN
ncbi:MAG: hypothetical protein PHI23_03290 [Candidatus Peribacteraceae bacterium]|nr:hypothetical protein [Candidatus Peribacteraceae bacterium]